MLKSGCFVEGELHKWQMLHGFICSALTLCTVLQMRLPATAINMPSLVENNKPEL